MTPERRQGYLQLSEEELEAMLKKAAKEGAEEVINTFGERFTYKAGAWFLDKLTYIAGTLVIAAYLLAKKNGLVD
jgi:2-iminoacetate synthase ThiH